MNEWKERIDGRGSYYGKEYLLGFKKSRHLNLRHAEWSLVVVKSEHKKLNYWIG